jgi:hypothetical protein
VNSTELHLWLWTITDEITGKRRQTRYRMTEEQARERFGDDAQKVEGSFPPCPSSSRRKAEPA